MSKVILTLTVLALFSIASAATLEEVSTLWGAWKTAHNKRYLPSEENYRFMIFQQNVAQIAKLNAEYIGATFAVNQFSDLTSEEFKQQFTTDLTEDYASAQESHPSPITETAPLPASFDWRTKGAVTPVKYQGNVCGSCWAFTAVAALESLNIIANKKTLLRADFSEQQMVDCGSAVDGLNGCRGGNLRPAFEYAIRYGLMNESVYPYTARDSICRYFHRESEEVTATFLSVPPGIPEYVKSELMKNPIAVSIQGNQDVFQHYKSGVISTGCGAQRSHTVLIVGYQKVNGQEAWIVKNSWGTSWGMQGYAYISTDKTYNDGQGACGILTEPLYPYY